MDSKLNTLKEEMCDIKDQEKKCTFAKESKQNNCLKHLMRSYNINRRKDLMSIAVLISINMVTGFLDSLVAVIVFQENQQSTFRTETFSSLCETLSMHPDDDFATFTEWTVSVNEQGEYLCKTRNATKVVEKIVEKLSRISLSRGLEETQYLSCGNQSLAQKSGYLTAYFSRISDYQNSTGHGFQVIVNWDKHPKHSYIHQAISYNDGEVTIPESRSYFIYASVVFNINQTEDQKQNIPSKLTLRICRKVYGYERTLLGKTELHRQSNRTILTSLSVAGQFILQKDDILLVRVSRGLKLDWKGNVFGLFPL